LLKKGNEYKNPLCKKKQGETDQKNDRNNESSKEDFIEAQLLNVANDYHYCGSELLAY
jgi:hypothetical protein